MRKRKIRAGITIGMVVSVTTLFVIKVLATSSMVYEIESNNDSDVAVAADVVTATQTMGVVDGVNASPPITEREVIEYEYVPDVSSIEETYISDEAYAACVQYGDEYGIAPELLMAIIERESQGDPTAFNGTDSGLMQVTQKWHYDRMERLGVTDLFDTDQNIHTGTDFLAELFNNYEDEPYVLMIYNMGFENANKYYSQGIISEYAQGIIARADELQLLHAYGGK